MDRTPFVRQGTANRKPLTEIYRLRPKHHFAMETHSLLLNENCQLLTANSLLLKHRSPIHLPVGFDGQDCSDAKQKRGKGTGQHNDGAFGT